MKSDSDFKSFELFKSKYKSTTINKRYAIKIKRNSEHFVKQKSLLFVGSYESEKKTVRLV